MADRPQSLALQRPDYLKPCYKNDAADLVDILIGSYPNIRIDNVKIYTRAMTSLFAEYPRDVGMEAIGTVTKQCRFIPTRAEVFGGLELHMTPLRDRWLKEAAELRRKEEMRRAAVDREIAEARRKEFLAAHDGLSPLEVIRKTQQATNQQREVNQHGEKTGLESKAGLHGSGRSGRSEKRGRGGGSGRGSAQSG